MALKQWLELVPLLERAVDPVAAGGRGLHGAAVLSPAGEPVGWAGALEHYELRALAALVSREGPPELLRALFDGELASATYDQRTAFLGIAGRCVFVVAVAGDNVDEAERDASELREGVEVLIRGARAQLGEGWVPPVAGSGGGSSSPAEAFAWPPRPREPSGRN